MPRCVIANCHNPKIANPQRQEHISYHSFPHDPVIKEIWIAATGRKDWFPTEHSTICSTHFENTSFKQGKKLRLLKKTACPTINILKLIDNDDEADAEPSTEEYIKVEIEDDFSEHEDYIEEKIANRKRQHEVDPLELDKRMKPTNQGLKVVSLDTTTLKPVKLERIDPETDFGASVDVQMPQLYETSEATQPNSSSVDMYPKLNPMELLTVEVERDSSKEDGPFTMDFMKSVLNSQKEILTVLKSQVLLQDQDPGMISFLRLVGAKLSRMEETKRREMQIAIIDLLNKNDE